MRRFTCLGSRGALVLALVLVKSSCVTHGVRTTPSALRSSDALPDETTTPSTAGGNTITHYEGQITVLHQERGQAAREADEEEGMVKESSAVTGSRLPDCTHACGPCFPCKRVMVSFRCADAEAAEPCPIAYRCMCRGRFFHVPTL